MPIPESNTFPSYFAPYINLVESDNIASALKDQMPEAEKFLNSITGEQSLIKYAEGKWTIREVLQHIIDAERIFAYRALCIARKEKSVLHSFDEVEYAANTNANRREWKDLIGEFLAVRNSTIFLFDSFTQEDLNTSGKVSDYEISILPLGYTIAGHAAHHFKIIRERYLAAK